MPAQLRIIIMLVVLMMLFIYQVLFIIIHPITQLDISFSLLLQKQHSNMLDRLMTGISVLGETPYFFLCVLLTAAAFYLKGFNRESVFVLSSLLSGLVMFFAKNIVNRPRPANNLIRVIQTNASTSFPSGTVLTYIVFFGFLIILMIVLKGIAGSVRIGIVLISSCMIACVPFARIYLGAHWLTDTIGGCILGCICLLILCWFYFISYNKV